MHSQQIDNLLGAQVGELETGTSIFVDLDGVQMRRQASTIIGIDGHKSLIIRVPQKFNSYSFKLAPGNGVSIRFLSNGSAYGFHSKILYLVPNPVGLMIIQYPDILAVKSIRESGRSSTYLPALIEAREGDPLTGMITDFSLSGCQFQLKAKDDESITRDKVVRLSITVPNRAQPLHVFGEVKNLEVQELATVVGVLFKNNAGLAMARCLSGFV